MTFEIANRSRCEGFDKFKPVFISVQKDLDSGVREARSFKDGANVEQGDLFIPDDCARPFANNSGILCLDNDIGPLSTSMVSRGVAFVQHMNNVWGGVFVLTGVAWEAAADEKTLPYERLDNSRF